MSQPLMFRDKSIVSLSGASQTATGLLGNRQFLLVQNTGANNIAVNMIGGTAAIGGTGCVTVTPQGSILLDRVVPQNIVNVIGTAGQPVTVIEA